MTRFQKTLGDKVIGVLVKERNYACHKYLENEVRVKRAPEPTDIIWENLKFKRREKILPRSILAIIVFSTIALSLGVIFIGNWFQVYYCEKLLF